MGLGEVSFIFFYLFYYDMLVTREYIISFWCSMIVCVWHNIFFLKWESIQSIRNIISEHIICVSALNYPIKWLYSLKILLKSTMLLSRSNHTDEPEAGTQPPLGVNCPSETRGGKQAPGKSAGFTCGKPCGCVWSLESHLSLCEKTQSPRPCNSRARNNRTTCDRNPMCWGH